LISPRAAGFVVDCGRFDPGHKITTPGPAVTLHQIN
jgi:hypothetical protein